MKKKIAFSTFGCKLNFTETSQISRDFVEKGFSLVDFKEDADIYVINTCTVTENAEKKCKAAIKQALKRNPNAKIAVVGCFSQLNPSEIIAIKGVDVVLGNSDKFNLIKYIESLENKDMPVIQNSDISKDKKFAPSYSLNDRTRSFFKVQDGCDYFCSYCAIPYARGRSRSETIEKTIEIAKNICNSGIKEIVLTGINLGDFGKKNGESFLQLLQELEKLEKLQRIRISSIEPDLLTKDIITLVANSKVILPHFHIPLQSGSNSILYAMKRKYTTSLFADRVSMIREILPNSCIACDVIVGFPGENDVHFEETYNFIQKTDLSYAHVFTYSERPDTIAKNIFPKISDKIKKERSIKLHKLSTEKKNEFYKKNIGYQATVLWESDVENGYIYGFTDNYIRVKTIFNPILINEIKKVHLTTIDTDGVFLWNENG